MSIVSVAKSSIGLFKMEDLLTDLNPLSATSSNNLARNSLNVSGPTTNRLKAGIRAFGAGFRIQKERIRPQTATK